MSDPAKIPDAVSPGRPEAVKPYGAGDTKGKQVEAMFDNIAPAYDFMNTAMTFGLHRRWLRKALEALRRQTADTNGNLRLLDLATGTGEVAFSLARLFPGSEILGIDLSEGMLRIACEKLSRLSPEEGRGRIAFRQGDCLALECEGDTFDALTIAYGVRNFEDLAKGFREFHRVLKPGGVCMILELSRPENRAVRPGYDLYSRTLIPLIGRMVSRDRRAYSYLPESIAAMPARRRVAEMLREAGFSSAWFKSLTLGVVTYYIARK